LAKQVTPSAASVRLVATSETLNLDLYLARIVGADQADGFRHLAQATVLKQATILDYAVNEVLAVRLAMNAEAASLLAFDVFGRISTDVRVGMLRSLMEDHDMVDRWPFVLPVLRKLFEVRNRVAHGFMERSSDDRIRVTTYNRDRETRVVYEPASCSLHLVASPMKAWAGEARRISRSRSHRRVWGTGVVGTNSL
jgi:hypothetical protein